MYSFIGLSVKIESIFFSFFFDSDLSKSDSTFHIWINPTKTIVQICQIFISTILISSLQEYFVTHENPNFSFDLSEIFRISVRGKLYFDILPDSNHLFIFPWRFFRRKRSPFLWSSGVKKCETFRKLSANCSNLPPSAEKWKSVFPRAEIFPNVQRRNGGMREGEEKINALRPRRGIDWSLSSVRESRSSRRFRLAEAVIPLRTSRVNCRIKGKREKKKKERKKRKK